MLNGRGAERVGLHRTETINLGSVLNNRRLMSEAETGSQGTAAVPRAAQVLIVEDNRADVFLVERAVEHYHVPAALKLLEDGEQAIKYLESLEDQPDAPIPSLLLLDLNLPKRPGTEVLRRLRASGRCRNIPVIVLTSSDSADDRRVASEYGASCYFRKPTSYDEFLKIGHVMNEVLSTNHC